MEKSGATWHVKFQTKIDAPPDKVYEAFAQPERSHEFSPDNVMKSELVSQSGNIKVVDIVGKLDVLPPGFKVQDLRTEFTLYPDEKRITSKSVDFKLADLASEYKFEPADGGKATLITFTQTSKDKGGLPVESLQKCALNETYVRQVQIRGIRAHSPATTPPAGGWADAAVKITRPDSSVPRPPVAAARPCRKWRRGPPNVGKSSLLNALLGRRAGAHQRRRAGATAELLLVNDGSIMSISQATGSRSAPGGAARLGTAGGGDLRDRSTLRGVALLVDVRRGFETERTRSRVPRPVGLPAAVVATNRQLGRGALVRAGVAAAHRRRPGASSVLRTYGVGKDALWRLSPRLAGGAGATPRAACERPGRPARAGTAMDRDAAIGIFDSGWGPPSSAV
jgi:hypothetical protein